MRSCGIMNDEIGIGIIGLGHVGKGTLDILEKNQPFIHQEISPCKMKIIGLADLNRNRKPGSEKYNSIFTTSAQEVIEHPETRIIVEAIGGEYPAYDLIKKSLQSGRHVVTPNKEVIAKHGYELLDIARQNQVRFLFEATVGSAIPILGVISSILTSCPLEEIMGIVNGTTNYMLDLMFEKNITQKEALKKAQDMGYAEADPDKDISGLDALYKIFILSSLGFRAPLDLKQIEHSGILNIASEDIQLAKQLGYRIKLLATARKRRDCVNIRVQPVLIDRNHPLAAIHGVNNGIMVYGESYGELFFSGAGAGGGAGGSMVVSDIVRIIKQPKAFEYDYLLKNPGKLTVQSIDQGQSPYFIRIQQQKGQGCRDRIEELFTHYEITAEKLTEMIDPYGHSNLGILTTLLSEDKCKKLIREVNQQGSGIQIINFLKVYRDRKSP